MFFSFVFQVGSLTPKYSAFSLLSSSVFASVCLSVWWMIGCSSNDASSEPSTLYPAVHTLIPKDRVLLILTLLSLAVCRLVEEMLCRHCVEQWNRFRDSSHWRVNLGVQQFTGLTVSPGRVWPPSENDFHPGRRLYISMYKILIWKVFILSQSPVVMCYHSCPRRLTCWTRFHAIYDRHVFCNICFTSINQRCTDV